MLSEQNSRKTGVRRKKSIRQVVTLLLGVSILAFSCDKDDDYEMSNQEFVTTAASSNNFEIAAGALAQTKGTNVSVKNYGEHMVTDHTMAGVELKALADKKSWNVPTNLLTKHQQNLQMLTAASSAEFDVKFAQLMVQSHQEAVSLFETAAAEDGVPDAELRALAAAKLPALKTHLQQAIVLQSTVAP